MLKRLRLRNFKSWRDTGDIAMKPITGFFGTNSSGKSSLIQALLLLKQTADSPDRGIVFHFGGVSDYVELGDFESVVHKHETGSALEISLGWKTEKPFEVSDPVTKQKIVESTHIAFQVASQMKPIRSGQRLVVDRMSYSVGKTVFGMRRKSEQGYELFTENSMLNLLGSRGRPWDIPSLIKYYGFPDTVRANYQNVGFLSDLEFALEQRLGNVYYLGPLRAVPRRVYGWSGAQPSNMGQAGESVVDAILAARERGQTIGRGRGKTRLTLEQYVAQWLKDLGLIHDFRVVPLAEGSRLFEVKVRKSLRGTEVLMTDVGFGVSQILPVLVLCFYVPEGSTVILEQPEIHLHPLAQAGLADVFIDAWKKRKVQILVESHSEHLLRRLQRRVAEESISANDIGLFFLYRRE